jgi:hypothetical protein
LLVTIHLRLTGATAAKPRIAWLLASVPPPLKMISSGFAPISFATSARAFSIAERAARPSGVVD